LQISVLGASCNNRPFQNSGIAKKGGRDRPMPRFVGGFVLKNS